MNTYFNQKIERIICPFDFTPTGRAGLEYAALVAKALGARLTIFYIQPAIWPESLQLYEDRNDNARAIKRHLQIEAKGIEDMFGTSCDYAIEPTTDSIEMSIGAMSADYDLIVMGSNGADDLYQHVFGANSHHVLGLAGCPVLIIPEGYEARIPKLIIHAIDPETSPQDQVSHLDTLAIPLNAEVRPLNVIPDKDTREAERKMQLLGELLGVREDKGFDWGFEPSYSNDVVASVDNYMKDTNADILALSYHHRLLFEKLFQENVTKEISRVAEYPILVFWH